MLDVKMQLLAIHSSAVDLGHDFGKRHGSGERFVCAHQLSSAPQTQ